MHKKQAIIVGAGPAGLTAAFELLKRTDIKPIVFEMTEDIGGISKTKNYKGNRIDIGGHRFFSKSDRVMKWWDQILPFQTESGPDPLVVDKVMLIRKRLSRIFFLNKLFAYPISLKTETLINLGLKRTLKIGLSYLKIKARPIKVEKSLADFLINRFGNELYQLFFKDYTEKVWGISCREIKPEWGKQRIKGLSITKAVLSALKQWFKPDDSIAQKNTETSLIEQFLYPKFGPGQMWEEVAKQILEMGGEIHLSHRVIGVKTDGKRVTAVVVKETSSSTEKIIDGDLFFSTMAVQDLIAAFDCEVPSNVKDVAEGLQYRDFITVGLLVKRLKLAGMNQKIKQQISETGLIPDTWLYIQDARVKLGRIQVFNNWSPFLVKDPNTVWMGLEYFGQESDDLFQKSDTDFSEFAVAELAMIGFIDKNDVLDSTVIRMPKTYPGYFGTYERFDEVRKFVDAFSNLYLIGRNGQHRYNNADHSMLTAMTAVDNIIDGNTEKENIWSVNSEQSYHES